MAQILPHAPLSDRANEAHGNAIAFSQRPTAAVLFGRGENLQNIALGQFGHTHGFALSAKASRAGAPMRFTFKNSLGILSGPVVITATKTLNFVLRSGATPHSLVADRIRHILLGRRPVEIFWRVVRLIIVAVRAMVAWVWPRAIERRANQNVNTVSGDLPVVGEMVSRILPTKARAKDAAHVLALPIRGAAPNASQTRNFIVGSELNHAPLLSGQIGVSRINSHVAVLSRSGQGRALLTQRFRPAFSNRFTFCSQGGIA